MSELLFLLIYFKERINYTLVQRFYKLVNYEFNIITYRK